MQPIQKKAIKSNKIKIRIAVLLLLLLIVLAIYIICHFDKKDLPTLTNEDVSVQLIDKPVESLISIDVKPANDAPFVLLQLDDQWLVKGQPDYPLDTTQIELMMKDLTNLVANELLGRVDQNESSLAVLGLDKNAPRVVASYSDGSSLTLVFGHSARTEIPSDYLMVLGEDNVYGVSPETRDHFDRSLNTLHPVPSLSFNTDLIHAIEFSGNNPLTLLQKNDWWQITSPFDYPINENALSCLLNRIAQMRLAVYTAEATTENLIKYGLDVPSRTLTLFLAESIYTQYNEDHQIIDSQTIAAQKLIFSVGKQIDNLGFYCLYNGKIYKASITSMGFIQSTLLDDMLSPTPANVPINRLSSLKVTHGQDVREYTIQLVEHVLPNNQFATDDAGNILYQPYVMLNNTEINADDFSFAYVRLATLKRSGKLPDDFSTAHTKPVITYRFTGEGIKLDISFYHYDVLHYAMQVNDNTIDFVSKKSVEQIGL